MITTVFELLVGTAFAALAALTLNLLTISVLRVLPGGRRSAPAPEGLLPADLPRVLIQLPLYNEPNVVARVVHAVAAFDWPRDRMRIQVLDDSTDETVNVAAALVADLRQQGFAIEHIRRRNRHGYKAGALAHGLTRDDSRFVAIFDADFVPPPDFLRRMMATLLADERLGFVQARWEHLNANENPLTAAQATMIDAHFAVEQRVRFATGLVAPFNGTCGIWRTAAIAAAGGWSADMLCEDLDLSIRARLAGWHAAFRDDLAVPGELPTTLAAWRAQQFRWTKGFAQVVRRLLLPVWRSRLSVVAKLALTMQTIQPICYPLTMISLLGTLFLLVDTGENSRALSFFGGGVAVLGIGCSAVFLSLGRAILRRPGWRQFPWRFIIILMLNAGLMVSNSRAVLEALIGRPSPFARTPKRGERGGALRLENPGPSGAAELISGCGFAVALLHEAGWLSPLFSLSIGGLIIVGAGLARERWNLTARRAESWPQSGRGRQPAD